MDLPKPDSHTAQFTSDRAAISIYIVTAIAAVLCANQAPPNNTSNDTRRPAGDGAHFEGDRDRH
jgi:hypothetical protein